MSNQSVEKSTKVCEEVSRSLSSAFKKLAEAFNGVFASALRLLCFHLSANRRIRKAVKFKNYSAARWYMLDHRNRFVRHVARNSILSEVSESKRD